MTSIVDLDEAALKETQAHCDVCVIGAGAAGLYVAGELARRGRSVIVLDAGGRLCESGAAIGIEAAFGGMPYRGATEGRAFGYGGSTSRWGGLLAPHCVLDLAAPSESYPDTWREIVNAVDQYSTRVFAALGLSGRPDFLTFAERMLDGRAPAFRDAGLTPLASEFLPFTGRNLSYLVNRSSAGTIRLFLHAVACKWSIRQDAGGIVLSVAAVSRRATRVRVSAGSFVIAAGAIESARMLLEINRDTNGRLLPSTATVGQFLSDHLSCAVAHVEPESLPAAIHLFAPAFANGRMRSLRFIETTRVTGSPRHFAHFIFDNEDSGFRLAKDVLSAVQRGRLPRVSLSAARDGVAGVAALAYARAVKSRLFISRNARARLQLDIEQLPSSSNAVSLGRDLDAYGRPVASVQWQMTDADRAAIATASSRLMERWPTAALGDIHMRSAHEPGGDAPKPHDAYHPVGVCRMGTDDAATVSLDLSVKGTRNLFLLSTGVLPSAGSANPTFSMLCLGDRLAEQLSGIAERQAPVPVHAS
jgi:choline dehydrogenase-like flavoprotein